MLHSLVIHLDGAHPMARPAHLHLAGLLPLLLIFQPPNNLISDIVIIKPTCKTKYYKNVTNSLALLTSDEEPSSHSDPPHTTYTPRQGGGQGPARGVHGQDLRRGE